MKKSLLIICLSLIGGIGFANTQKGIVKTKGRLNADQTITKGEPLSDAFVTVQGAQTVSSNKKGLFSVTLTSKDYYLKDVTKEGYVLCDADALSHSYAYSPNPIYIVMETPAQQMEDKLIAERKLRRTLQRQLTQREEEIDSLKTKQQISDEEYRQQLQQIYADQEENERLIKEMADRYASIDYDQLDEYNRQISTLILEGKLTEADSLIRTKGDISSRIETLKEHQDKNQQEEQALKKRMKALEKSKAYTQKELKDLAQDCYSLYEIFKMQHKNDSAAYYLELRASLDTTHVEWLVDLCSFEIDNIGDYSSAKAHGQKALKIAAINCDTQLLAKCYKYVGIVYNYLGDYEGARDLLLRGKDLLHDSIEVRNKYLLQNLYNDLGVVYDNMREFEKSYFYYKKALDTGRELYGDKHYGVALSYNNIGYLYNELEQYDDALKCFQNALDIQNELFNGSHADIGISLMNIGGVYSMRKEYEQALSYFLSAIKVLEENLHYAHPMLGGGYNNIANTYSNIGKYAESLEYYKKALKNLIVALGEDHPQIGFLYGNIASLYEHKKCYKEAIEYSMKAINCLSNLFGENTPNSINVAAQYAVLGRLYSDMGNYSLAEEALLKNLEIRKNIYKTPHRRLYLGYDKLADFYYNIEEYGKAQKVYVEMLDVTKDLYGTSSEELSINYSGIYHSLIAEYKKTGSKKCLEDFNEFMKDHVITLTVQGHESPAAQKGMSGEYYLLSIERWTPEQPISLTEKVNSLADKPKTIIVMKDNEILEYSFQNSMGVHISYKQIDTESNKKMKKNFSKWMANRK